MNTLTYNIPNVNCGHCKMMIERKVGGLMGVTSVNVHFVAKLSEI